MSIQSSSHIRIHPPGTKVTDQSQVSWLQNNTPSAFGLAKKILVTSTKYLKGGGWFSTKKRRGEQLYKRIYQLESELRKYKFREIQMYVDGPPNVIIEYFSLVSDAYPNWQAEYELLNDFIPNCPKYKNVENQKRYKKIIKKPSEEAFKEGVLQNKFGDYLYPGEEGHEELSKENSKKKPIKVNLDESKDIVTRDIGMGYEKQRLFLKKGEDGTFEVIARRVISSGNPEDHYIKDLTGTEVGTLMQAIEESLRIGKSNFEVKVELTDVCDITSPLRLLINPKS